jgi:hypothetical protein
MSYYLMQDTGETDCVVFHSEEFERATAAMAEHAEHTPWAHLSLWNSHGVLVAAQAPRSVSRG